MHTFPIQVEQTFKVSGATLWNAITQHEQMIQWYFENIPSFEATVGFKTGFNVNSGERDFYHLWEVTEVIPQQKIVYNWKYTDYEGDSNVYFEIIAQDEQSTTLRLTHEVVEAFDQNIPEFKPESCLGGWTYFIKERLVGFLK